MEPSDRPAGRHRAPERPAAPPRAAGGAHRTPEPAPVPAPATVPPAADERAADLARFLAAARDHSVTAASATARYRPDPALRPWPRRIGVVAVVAVAAVGLGAAVHGLRAGAGSAPTPAVVGTGTAPPTLDATTETPVPTASTPTTSTPTTSTPTTSTPTTSTPAASIPAPRSPAAGPPASRPPVKVREVPVVPVPATANGAAWQGLVTRLFTARSGAFATGRPALLTTADAPGSALLRADRQLYAAAIERAGFTRAAGLGFDLDRVRLLASGPTTARLAVAGRERGYTLSGAAGQRAVAAGPRRELTLQLSRSSTTAPWLLSAGSIRPVG